MPMEYEETALDACNDLPRLHFQLIGFLLLLSQKSGFLHSCAGSGAELVDDYPAVYLRTLRVLKLSRHKLS
ncbi:hypothetical protein TB1_007872 [Malus domestica]